jgi:hypothetical protein
MLSVEVRQVAEILKHLSVEDKQWLLQQLIQQIPPSGSKNLDDEMINDHIKKKTIPKAGLHLGAMVMSDDFDQPLPDEFWLS